MIQMLKEFGIYIVLLFYSIYFKFFGKDNVHQKQGHMKVSSKKAKNITIKNSVTLESYGLKLFRIIESISNIKLLEKLLNINSNIVNQQDKNGNTPLMLSIIHNQNELLISKLLSFISDINIKNNNGDNCLMLAIENGNKKLVDLILNYRIDVNSQNNKGQSPLFMAFDKHRSDIVASLLTKNINWNIRNSDGKLPIEIALINENMDLLKMIFDNGATTLVKDLEDEYVIFQLMNRPDLLKDVIELESKSPNKKDLILTLRNKEGYTLFMEFCRYGYQKLAKFMIKHKVDLNYVNRGENALTIAVREGQLDIVNLLLTSSNIDINHLTNDHMTPLRLAIENQNIPVIKTLINIGGANILKNENETLLKNAINTSNIDIVNLLLDININVDVQFGREKNTPLIYTIKKAMKDMNIESSEDEDYSLSNTFANNSDLEKEEEERMSDNSSSSSVKTLAINKSTSITDNNYYSRVFSNMDIEDEKSNLQSASHSPYDSDYTLSDTSNFEQEEDETDSNQSFGSSKDELVVEHVKFSDPKKVSHDKNNKVTGNSVNTDIPKFNPRSSFNHHVNDNSVVVDDSYCDMIKALLRYHAKVNLTNNSKDSALILACRYGLKNVVEMLLKENHNYNLNIDLNLTDRNGNTALHNACKKNYTAIIRMLLAEDTINVNIPNQNGNTALMIAVYENNIEVIHELLKCSNININSLNVQLETPLIAACRMNNYRVAKLLLDNKAIINKRYDLNGETAVFHAVRNNNKKLTALLLENEASVSFKNKAGKSPLTIAKEYKYKSIVSLLFSHFKNQQTLKNKSSTLSLNENLVRLEDKKAFWNGGHSHNRNASLNLPNLTSTSSIINELKNNNKPSLKVNHNRNNSVTFNRNIISIPISPSGLMNSKHTRHESISNENNIGLTKMGNSNGRTKHHIRNRSFNPEWLSRRNSNNTEKFVKGESYNPPEKSNEEIKMDVGSTFRPKKVMGGEFRHGRSYSTNSESSVSSIRSKNSSIYNINKANYNESNVKVYAEPEGSEGEESDTEITTNYLIQKAKERVERTQSENYITRSNSTSSSNKSLKHTSSKNSIRGSEIKKDEYLKPLKTACYNQNIEDIKKFYENIVQEKGNIYKLPEDLFEQVKNCKNEQEWESIIQKIKEFNKTRPLVQNDFGIEMFAFTLLFFSDNAEGLKIMLQYGLNPNLQNNAFYTLLILACKKSRSNSALVLLDYNADPNIKNKYDETALILACKKGLVDVIDRLLQYNVNVNIKNDKGETALIMACWKKNLDIVERLLRTNVDVNMKNNLDESPLFLSCLQNSLDIVEMLLKHGADVNTVNKNNETPLMIARKNNNTEMVNLLLKYGAKDE